MEFTPLILAASAGREKVVKLLLNEGASVNAHNSGGHSALQYAASKNWKSIVVALLERDANVNIADKRGATPLHRAASKGNIEIVRLLLEEDNVGIGNSSLTYRRIIFYVIVKYFDISTDGVLLSLQIGRMLTVTHLSIWPARRIGSTRPCSSCPRARACCCKTRRNRRRSTCARPKLWRSD